jgi:uncharacterized protein YfiM (DUF2279 family)
MQMNSLGRKLGKKATKATLRHSVRGLVSKAQRRPFRSATLLTAGGVVGLTAGWVAGRKTARTA